MNLRLVRLSGILVLFIILLTSLNAIGQVESGVKAPAGTLPVKNDTTGRNLPDTLVAKADTVSQDSLKRTPPRKGDIETTINYSAKDSIMASLDGKMIWLYGEAKITYGSIELEAEEIIIDYANRTIAAQGRRDSLGNRIGYPIFKNGQELYETKGIVYNFETRRAKIREVVTTQGDGFLQSEVAFKNEKNEIFSINNSYTTCNLEHPHFRIRATKTKAIPNDKIVAGPFYLEFNDIPLPAGFLFGMFPAQRESASGIIFPTYGDERRRGFNLRRGGYFFDISDYIKLAVTGDIYSKGSHAVYANSDYIKRYAYQGRLNFSYSKTRSVEKIEDRTATNDFSLQWNHTPQSKGTGRFSASVNAATSSYNQNNNLMYGAPNELTNNRLSNITSKLSSNVSYNKRFAGTPFSMGINLTHNQDLQRKTVDLALPNLSLNMTNIYPFQRKGQTGPLDNFSIGYTSVATNKISNNIGRLTPEARTDSIATFNLDNLGYFMRNGKKGIRHTIPISYSFKALKYFTVSPSFNFEEKWYFERQNYDTLTGGRPVLKGEPEKVFNRIGNYNTGVAIATRIYGMYFFKNPNKRVKAIRHIINPNFGMSYAPDYRKEEDYFNNWKKGKTTIYQSRHQGFAYGGSGTGNSASLNFGIGNNLEMKVKSPKDTVEKKVMLLNNLSINSGYNLLAEEYNLAPISIAANTSVLDNKININLSSTLDPYNYVDVVRIGKDGGITSLGELRQTKLAWQRNANLDSANHRIVGHSGNLGRITNATLAFSTNLNPKAREKEQSTREKVAQSDLSEGDKQAIMKDPNAYVDFDIPWTLSLGFNLNYTHGLNAKPKIVQALQLSGTLSLSEKWMVRYNSGYDFESAEFTQTNLGISRDLHCWTMALDWVPFGRFQSYNFTIAVKASVLSDLKLERRKPFFDNLQ